MTPRIVSLLPSATEIICALGFGSHLVGRSHECDFPAYVERLPICTETKVGSGLTSDEIHASVERILQHDLGVYRVDSELLKQLAPTHVVTQVQCEVCAVSLRDVEVALGKWSGTRPRIVPLNPRSLHDVLEDILRTAATLDADEAGVSLVAQMRQRMHAIAREAVAIQSNLRVATIEWLSPLMSGGNWMPEIIAMAGGVNLFGEAGRHSPRLLWDDLLSADPDVLLIFPCGFRIEQTERDFSLLVRHPSWPKLQAVRNRQVFLIDGNQYVNRPGPRLVESLEIVAEILHGEHFYFAHEGKAWKRWVG